MKRLPICVAVVLLVATPVSAQTTLSPPQTGPADYRGFTVLANIGFGIQHDSAVNETAFGLAGVNVGAGWFITRRAAAMFRLSGTAASFDAFAGETQTSGVVGGSVQYWITDRLAVEGGAGFGYWTINGTTEGGFGLILGVTVPVFSRGSHHIVAGAEYAPAFTEPSPVHNIGFTIGYQFRRRQ